MRNPCWSRLAGKICDLMGYPSWSSLFLKDYTLWKGSHTGAGECLKEAVTLCEGFTRAGPCQDI